MLVVLSSNSRISGKVIKKKIIEGPNKENKRSKIRIHNRHQWNTKASDYHEQLYTNKMDNLETKGKFQEMYNLPRLNQQEIENMNRPITSNKI